MHPVDRHKRVALQFSGGKDSVAALLLLRDYWKQITVYHLDTGDLNPETRKVVDDVAALVPHFVRIQSDVFAVKREYGLPSDVIPWSSTEHAHGCNAGFSILMQDRVACCFRTFMLPMHQRMVQDGITLIIRGQKASDTFRGPLKSGDIVDGFEFYFPTEGLSDDECLRLHRESGLHFPDYYELGIQHVGDCLGCTAWCVDDRRVGYIKERHPLRFHDFRREMLTIADAVEQSSIRLFATADACL